MHAFHLGMAGMFGIPFLRNLMLVGLVILSCLPLYSLLVLHPAYRQHLIHETEEEAVHFARYLLRAMQLEGMRADRDHLPPAAVEQMQLFRNDRRVIKVRLFSPSGEIVISTDAEEVGKANSKDYFREIVARGQVYSQVVSKDQKTADGDLVTQDVVETYVPWLVAGQFGGAIEVYSDITSRVASIKSLTLRTSLIIVLLASGMLVAMFMALNKAKISFAERDRAEAALLQINEDLEGRVAARTAELTAANAQLTAEIAERSAARTALSQALEASRLEREKLDGILHSVGDGLIVTDHQLAVLHMNAATEQLLELSLEKALGQPLDRLACKGDLANQVRTLLAGSHSPSTFDFELPGEDPRHPRVFQVRFSRLESEQDQPGVVLLLHEVTRERQLDRMKNAFLGMAAHELNAPLAAILGLSELLTDADYQAGLTPRQQADYLQTVHSKAQELSRLVDDLLDISRIEAGQPLVLNYQPVRLDNLAREVLLYYQEKSPRHRFELHCLTAQTEIWADLGRIRQVFNNLVSNAVKYAPQGGLIKISLAEQAGCCRCSVSDEGIGMTPEQIEHSCDSFYRADSSNTAVQGVGLGMSIVRHIIQAHHGEMHIESQLGHGTTVHFALPVAPPPTPSATPGPDQPAA